MSEGKGPTLADVAALAGVSISTASLAFSGSGPVSPSTRDKVHAAAEHLRYAGPDPRARSLRQGRSGIVAVAMEESVLYALRDPIKIAFLEGIGQEIAPAGLALLLIPAVGSGPSALESAPTDAVILIGCSPGIEQSVQTAQRRSTPLVALGGNPFVGVPSITIDEADAIEKLARHLHDLGHRRVTVVALALTAKRDRGMLTPEWEAEAVVPVAMERLAGARRVFPDVPCYVAASSLLEEGRQACRELLLNEEGRLLPLAERPTAVMAQSDLLAAGVIQAAEELGLRVPADLSVVGFDGVDLDKIIPHDLTTMAQPATEQGRVAGRAAVDMIEGRRGEGAAFVCVYHPGGTVAPVPAPRSPPLTKGSTRQ